MADTSSIADNCVKCNKTPEEGATPFPRCSRCRSCRYCSKDCQKADWATHKKLCSSGTKTAGSDNTAFKLPKPALQMILSGGAKTLLHKLPEAQVFTLLIDSYRMRIEDDYVFRGDISNNSLYGQGDPRVGFREFLHEAEQRGGVLPSWWNAQKREQCIVKGADKKSWSCLYFAVEKHDVQEHYKDPTMPMMLRMLAEEIKGSNPAPF